MSAKAVWGPTARLLRFLSTVDDPPVDPTGLSVAHLEAFLQYRAGAISEISAWREIRELGLVLKSRALRELVPAEVVDFADRRKGKTQPTPKPGYSDREFGQLVTAARADVANIRDRIRAGDKLVDRHHHEPHLLEPDRREHATLLARVADTGEIPWPDGPMATVLPQRRRLAGELFLTMSDVAPVLVLLVAVTGRNVETIKELPIEHRVLDERAVELRVVKRRRGQKRWWETVTWEIGKPGRELHTPGGLYLLLHELTRRSRSFSGSRLLWSVWRNGHRAGVHGAMEHHGVFDKSLDVHVFASDWAQARGLTADRPTPADREDDDTEQPPSTVLRVDFNRLKTSVDVRRTKQMGGHLPSAARTNTVPVLFRNYLRGDPGVLDWAQNIVGAAIADAEQSALAAHRRALDAAGGNLRVIPGPADAEHLHAAGLDTDTARHAVAGALDTAWTECVDHDHHPATGKGCRASFLDCFHCGNCLITCKDLPGLLGLLDALAARRQQLSEQDWWDRYGRTWAAIRNDVLVKFSPAEIEQATTIKPDDALLDLIENPWEQP